MSWFISRLFSLGLQSKRGAISLEIFTYGLSFLVGKGRIHPKLSEACLQYCVVPNLIRLKSFLQCLVKQNDQQLDFLERKLSNRKEKFVAKWSEAAVNEGHIFLQVQWYWGSNGDFYF